MTTIEICTGDTPGDAHGDAAAAEAAIRDALAAHNAEAGWPHAAMPLRIALRDAAGGVVGGLVGMMNWHWLWVQALAMPPALRGQGWGARLLATAETEARARGCVGVRLDTYSFQARGFYLKQGYREAGRIEDCPPGQARYTMAKRLDRGDA